MVKNPNPSLRTGSINQDSTIKFLIAASEKPNTGVSSVGRVAVADERATLNGIAEQNATITNRVLCIGGAPEDTIKREVLNCPSLNQI
jgi:hypothetical protein